MLRSQVQVLVTAHLTFGGKMTVGWPAASDSTLWEEQPVQDAKFSKETLLGVATSEYQYSGQINCPNAQWAEWEKKLPIDKQSGEAWNLWNRPQECIAILQKLNVSSFRFSIEWSKIETAPGVYDESAIQHYVDFCRELKKVGIEPMITLHHFTNPLWFEKLGAFEKEENIAHFVSFAQKMGEVLKGEVTLIGTINEPTVYAFSGYFLGSFPPNAHNPWKGARVLKHLLMAHCQVYRALKQIDPKFQVGIIHQALKFVPYRMWNPIEVAVTWVLTRITHTVAMRFFETGIFNFWGIFSWIIPGGYFKEKEIHQLNDFIGVNCYVRPLISMFAGSTHYPHEAMTAMPFREDPAAIYEALMEMHKKTKKPLYVTEVGISTFDEKQLERYMERALYAIYRAKEAGVDLKGIYWWSLMNNWEWDRTWDHNFGICKDDGTPREGARPFLNHLNSVV